MLLTESTYIEDPLKKYAINHDLLETHPRPLTEGYECAIQAAGQYRKTITFEKFCLKIQVILPHNSNTNYEMYFHYLIANFS